MLKIGLISCLIVFVFLFSCSNSEELVLTKETEGEVKDLHQLSYTNPIIRDQRPYIVVQSLMINTF